MAIATVLATVEGTDDDKTGSPQVVSGHGDGTVRLWDAHRGRIISVAQAHSGAVTDLVIRGSVALTGSLDGTVHQWDFATGAAEVLTTVPNGDHVWRLALCPTYALVMSAPKVSVLLS